MGGGTSCFLKKILCNYKFNNNFLIVRNYNGSIKFTINDEFLIKKKFNDYEAKKFIKNINFKISKIFVNHLLGHTNYFLTSLLNLKKEVTLVTHDYYYIFNYPHPYYEEIKSNSFLFNNNNLNLFDQIVTQNIINLENVSNFIDDKKKIVVTDLPDFKNHLNLVKTSNTKITIGIIGDVSPIKGKNIVEELKKNIINNKLNIKVVIFGFIDSEYYDNNEFFKYNNINQLNDLLIEHKPNLLLETSTCLETYSFTLTLSMITQLPILSLEKPFNSVIKDRLKNYEKKYFYSTMNELITLVNKIKQDYFYTIQPYVFFSSFWDNYFSVEKKINIEKKNVENKNIVLITSKIITSNNPFSYTNKRSIYSSEERFEQTLETIESIKKYIPNYFIVLFDNSFFNQRTESILKKNVDLLINIKDDEVLNYYTNNYPFKAFSDIYQQIQFYETFMKYIEILKIKNFFKISGRYFINKHFNYNSFNNDKNIFKKNKDVKDRKYYYTCFFKLNKNILNEYFENLKNLFNNKDKFMNPGDDCEVIIPETINEKITLVENLGITQRIAVESIIEEI